MIITRTPLRIPLGGGSTDLPSYYKEHGGFIFAVAINLYEDVLVRRPPIDDKVRVNYSHKEIVDDIKSLQNSIARESLARTGITKNIEIFFAGDVPAGAGLGGSNSAAVGLLNALHALKGEKADPALLASESFQITQRLGLPDGKQDPYVAAFGGFVEFTIAKSGSVSLSSPNISEETEKKFLENTFLFYTGVHREGASILREQDSQKVIEMKHETKILGRKIFAAFSAGELAEFGRLMHEHWLIKKQMSAKMSNDNFDDIYDLAIKSGALGGKILGAGGGGFFLFYAEGSKREGLCQRLTGKGLRQIKFNIEKHGSRVIYSD